MKRSMVGFMTVVILATACGDASIETTVAPTSPASPVTQAPPGTTTSIPDDFDPAPVDDEDVGDVTRDPDSAGPEAGSLLDLALADLARRLGVQVTDIRVISSEKVTWRDGSLGCPEPGMGYTQALVPGWRALLEVDGVEYSYHAALDREPFLCEDPQEPLAGKSGA